MYQKVIFHSIQIEIEIEIAYGLRWLRHPLWYSTVPTERLSLFKLTRPVCKKKTDTQKDYLHPSRWSGNSISNQHTDKQSAVSLRTYHLCPWI